MRPIRLAIRYAKALFELAGEQIIRDQVFQDMKLLSQVCTENRDFRVMLQSPVIRFDKKNAVIKALFNQHFHSVTQAYTDIICRKRREILLHEIAEQYIILFREWKGIKTARLATAVAVDEQMKQRVITMLKQQMNVEIELETIVKPELIGGFLLSVEDRQLDSTILKKIKKLTREFNINIYERKI